MKEEIIIGVIAGVILLFIEVTFGWGQKIFRKFWNFITHYRPHIPRETVRVVPQKRSIWWGRGSVKGKPAMQISGHWYATNIISDPVLLLYTYIENPHTEGHILTRHPEQNIYGTYPILPGRTTEISTGFWIEPPICNEGKNLKVSVILVDQFGNKHKLKNVIFKGPTQKEPEKKETKEIKRYIESMQMITDPIEKNVVAVLKSEVFRYQECGRRVGGLGSIQTIYQGQTMKGVGTEWREADSPKNQSIVLTPEKTLIGSDNCAALLNLYYQLCDKEKERFVEILLKRLSRNTEYAPIGYLILLVCFRIGRLPDILKIAKRDLQNDGAFGFSDLLRLLDGLLRFEHPSFPTDLLDEIDRFLEGIDEHTFSIQERLVAIRTSRLVKK
jgi:hypothetical protein